MSRIRLRIERLVLNGLQHGQEKALVESLRNHLSQILADRGTRSEWARSHRTLVLKLGRMPITPGSVGAGRFGVQLARGIGKGLKP